MFLSLFISDDNNINNKRAAASKMSLVKNRQSNSNSQHGPTSWSIPMYLAGDDYLFTRPSDVRVSRHFKLSQINSNQIMHHMKIFSGGTWSDRQRSYHATATARRRSHFQRLKRARLPELLSSSPLERPRFPVSWHVLVRAIEYRHRWHKWQVTWWNIWKLKIAILHNSIVNIWSFYVLRDVPHYRLPIVMQCTSKSIEWKLILCIHARPLTHLFNHSNDYRLSSFPFHFAIKYAHPHTFHRCLDCQFPLCASGCISHDHTAFECQFFKSHNLVKYLHWESHRQELESDYEALTVLR